MLGKAAQLNQPEGLARLPVWGLHVAQDASRFKAPLASWPCVGASSHVARYPFDARAQSLSAAESGGPLVEEGPHEIDQPRSDPPERQL